VGTKGGVSGTDLRKRGGRCSFSIAKENGIDLPLEKHPEKKNPGHEDEKKVEKENLVWGFSFRAGPRLSAPREKKEKGKKSRPD